ncbi:MAG: dissimilatory-type sulfite reductase subunit alpha [Spirochaetes bacterium]|nr:dissimilatory-type sulfite reductase subunit alpha [Spirochaetota bacterium]HOD14396.1 dissimilatory-type sulfite reductase subunit alpha [Spirochaetota bacterium]HPG50053.1 dissimilatory-type sulfite reductase subunit alpha [Spirochaetota bacterium]
MSDTPLLDDLEKGPWPSFVKEMKRAALKSPAAKDLLGLVELSYKDRVTHWKHGGIVGVTGYGGGVIGRYSDVPEKFPNAEQFHTVRVNHPSSWFYNTESLRKICDLWEKYGSGLTNFHGSTGDIILLGTRTENIQKFFDELVELGFDLGGSGSVLRTPTGCVGPARCEWACFDSLDLVYDLTQTFQDQLHRPRWPYKFKIKASACPNDCVAAIARADFTIIGAWRDSIRIDQKEVKEYAAQGMDIKGLIADKCPGGALAWDEKKRELSVKPEDCTRCMHCINKMTKAIRPGTDRGASILIGGKAPIQKGAFLSWMLIPFMKVEPPYTEIKDLLEKIWDWWDEHGRNRERIAETIARMGFKEFLKALGLKPLPQMVKHPRSNPFIFFNE